MPDDPQRSQAERGGTGLPPALGFDFPAERFERIYNKFLDVADTKSEVMDDDLRTLVESA